MKRRRRNKRRRDVNPESSYLCDSCGEEIVIPIDPSQGSNQQFVEDCPVCCCPNVISVDLQEDGQARVWATRE